MGPWSRRAPGSGADAAPATASAAAEVGCHPSTILKALEAGELHGGQRVKKGKWRIHRDCLTAYGFGEPCQHQSQTR